MKIGSIELPDNCYREKCPEFSTPFYQGCLCTRCPLLNCSVDKNGFSMMKPEEYREDWAKEFKKFFDSGFEDYPDLRFKK